MQGDDGQSFLKLAATNYVTNTLICGKAAKNASLSNGAKMSELKALRNRALNPSSAKESAWEEADDDDAAAVEPKMKQRRAVQQTIDLEIDGTTVTLLVPAKRAMLADIVIKMDPKMLAAVFNFLKPDWLEKPKPRTYKKTGQHTKKNR